MTKEKTWDLVQVTQEDFKYKVSKENIVAVQQPHELDPDYQDTHYYTDDIEAVYLGTIRIGNGTVVHLVPVHEFTLS